MEPRFEARLVTKGEEVLDLEGAATVIDYEGQKAILCFHRDVTARKRAEEARRESEERYRTVVDNTFDAIIVYNKHRYLYANQAYLNMLGIPGSN